MIASSSRTDQSPTGCKRNTSCFMLFAGSGSAGSHSISTDLVAVIKCLFVHCVQGVLHPAEGNDENPFLVRSC